MFVVKDHGTQQRVTRSCRHCTPRLTKETQSHIKQQKVAQSQDINTTASCRTPFPCASSHTQWRRRRFDLPGCRAVRSAPVTNARLHAKTLDDCQCEARTAMPVRVTTCRLRHTVVTTSATQSTRSTGSGTMSGSGTFKSDDDEDLSVM